MRNSTLYKDKPKTFRRSSTQIWPERGRKNIGWGSNLQNLEHTIKEIYVSDGWTQADIPLLKYWLETGDTEFFKDEQLDRIRVLVQPDQSGAEALIVAYESDNADYRQLFINNIKPHVYVGLKLFKDVWPTKMKELSGLSIDIDEICATPIPLLKKNPMWRELDKLIKSSDKWPRKERYYYFAKQTCHSGNYDIQWHTFIMNVLEKSGGKVVLTKEDGMYFLQTYRGLFPEIPARNERIRQQVDKTHMLFNLFGHPFIITNKNITERTYKEYYAWSAQSTVGEITRTAFSTLQEYIEDTNRRWDILADTHDSYLVQCPLREVKECKDKAQEFMAQELVSPVDGTHFRMKSEAVVGFNWYEQKEHNPLGLRELSWT